MKANNDTIVARQQPMWTRVWASCVSPPASLRRDVAQAWCWGKAAEAACIMPTTCRSTTLLTVPRWIRELRCGSRAELLSGKMCLSGPRPGHLRPAAKRVNFDLPGLRIARPVSFRARSSCKVNLAQAEAIADLIDASQSRRRRR